jgi:hypothetical protein
MKKPLLFSVVVLLSSVLLTSCKKGKGGPCEEALHLSLSEVGVTFKNKEGEYLYKEINPLYNKDSLKVFDENGNKLILLSLSKLIPNTGVAYDEISFGTIYDDRTDQSSFNTELCKKFFIEYNSREKDTVQACFKAKKTECGSVFETLKVYHKGQLLASVQNTVFAQITLIKP